MKPLKTVSNIIGLGAIALIAAIPFAGIMPSLASLQSPDSAIAQPVKQQDPVQLKLSAERPSISADKRSILALATGQVEWKTLPANAALLPGDTIRYVVTARNISDRQIKKLVVTQPIPNGSVYVLNSATLPNFDGAKVAYSIDNGKNYSEKPTIRVKLESGEIVTRPAPESMYTNVRWNFGENFPANTVANATYQVRIR